MDNTNRHAKISWESLENMISSESGRCRYKPLNPTSSLVNIQTSNTKWIHQVTHTCAHTHAHNHTHNNLEKRGHEFELGSGVDNI